MVLRDRASPGVPGDRANVKLPSRSAACGPSWGPSGGNTHSADPLQRLRVGCVSVAQGGRPLPLWAVPTFVTVSSALGLAEHGGASRPSDRSLHVRGQPQARVWLGHPPPAPGGRWVAPRSLPGLGRSSEPRGLCRPDPLLLGRRGQPGQEPRCLGWLWLGQFPLACPPGASLLAEEGCSRDLDRAPPSLSVRGREGTRPSRAPPAKSSTGSPGALPAHAGSGG